MSDDHAITPLKACSSCKEEKPLSEYYRNKKTPDGLYRHCKACHKKSTSDYAKRNPGLYAEAQRRHRNKDREASNAKAREHQKRAYAKNHEIFKERDRKWAAENKHKISDYNRNRRKKDASANAEYAHSYYLANKEKIGARVREYSAVNKERLRPINSERAMRRIARKIRATPAWADIEAIRAFYEEAAVLRKATGVEYHVDHIVPLQSKLVCGLHVQSNLQVILGRENQSKSNRYWPDGPMDAAELAPALLPAKPQEQPDHRRQGQQTDSAA